MFGVQADVGSLVASLGPRTGPVSERLRVLPIANRTPENLITIFTRDTKINLRTANRIHDLVIQIDMRVK
jgi:hypothetical protein